MSDMLLTADMFCQGVPVQSKDSQQDFEKIFNLHHRTLCYLACRLTGSWPRAEEIVQDAFLRFSNIQNTSTLVSPGAWLKKVVTNLCLDELRSSGRRKTLYPGVNLPEPPVEVENGSPVDGDHFPCEDLSVTHLLCLNILSPLERAVFVLREGLDADYNFISEVVERTPVHCRQVFLRSRRKLHTQPCHSEILKRRGTHRDSEVTLQRLLEALSAKDIHLLCELLRHDIVYRCDGGGKANALPVPVQGELRVARLLVGMASQVAPDMKIQPVRARGEPGLLILQQGTPITLLIFDLVGNQVRSVHVQRNPDKLKNIPRP